MGKIAGWTVGAHWFDPRTGTAARIGDFANDGTRLFSPPTAGRGNDWVLVLDDAEKNRFPPGL
jgi:hypothetical protein